MTDLVRTILDDDSGIVDLPNGKILVYEYEYKVNSASFILEFLERGNSAIPVDWVGSIQYIVINSLRDFNEDLFRTSEKRPWVNRDEFLSIVEKTKTDHFTEARSTHAIVGQPTV